MSRFSKFKGIQRGFIKEVKPLKIFWRKHRIFGNQQDEKIFCTGGRKIAGHL